MLPFKWKRKDKREIKCSKCAAVFFVSPMHNFGELTTGCQGEFKEFKRDL